MFGLKPKRCLYEVFCFIFFFFAYIFLITRLLLFSIEKLDFIRVAVVCI